MDELAHHVVDIDIYHTTRDRAAYSGGLFWHTIHYASAGTATHRRVLAPADPPWRGARQRALLHERAPPPLLPDRRAKRRARRWWGWRAGSSTPTTAGRPSSAGSIEGLPGGRQRHAIARATMARDGARQRGERSSRRRFCLRASADSSTTPRRSSAAASIRATTWPTRDLLDAERRWSYTVFLQVLGRYLDLKVELR